MLGNSWKARRTRFFLLVPALLVVGCGLIGPTPEIGGTWLAQWPVPTEPRPPPERWEFELSGSSTVAGTFRVPSLDETSMVTGEYDDPAVSLSFEKQFLDASLSCGFRGTMAESGQTIAGTVSCVGGGYRFGGTMDLRRE